jgi:hypothetical protein
MRRKSRRVAALAIGVLAGLVLVVGVAGASSSSWTTISTNFVSPLFGLASAPNNQLVVADAGAGPTRLNLSNGSTSVITPLSGVTDTALTGPNDMFASTSGVFGSSGYALYRVSNGHPTMLANLLEFEQKNDPAKDGVDSDPFDLARLGSKVFIADAAANDILVYDGGKLDWVAYIPQHNVSTEWLKRASGCPSGPPDVCGLPARIDADPVPTSVAVGPDGMLYVGELTGFPATPGQSRIWRLDPNARHVVCGQSPSCVQVNTGPFTSIIDLAFGPDGTAYVAELDERSWLAAEGGFGEGGTVDACKPTGLTWSCVARNTKLPFPTAIALKDGKLYSTLFSVVPGQAQVALLP